MNRRHLLKAMGALALCPLCASVGVAAEGPHWSYEGRTGPDHWGALADAHKVGNDTYKLVQLHFHRPSEHMIHGKRAPMEVHFVHATAAGAYGVIGVMMTAGKPNAAFSKIVA